MDYNSFDELSDVSVPPLPREFDQHVHHRLNDRLLAAHLTDLGVCAVPFVYGHFASAVTDLLLASLPRNNASGPSEGD